MKFRVNISPSDSPCSWGSTFSKFRNFQGWDLCAAQADWLCSRRILVGWLHAAFYLFLTSLLKKSIAVRVVASCSKSCLSANMEFNFKKTGGLATSFRLYFVEEETFCEFVPAISRSMSAIADNIQILYLTLALRAYWTYQCSTLFCHRFYY